MAFQSQKVQPYPFLALFGRELGPVWFAGIEVEEMTKGIRIGWNETISFIIMFGIARNGMDSTVIFGMLARMEWNEKNNSIKNYP